MYDTTTMTFSIYLAQVIGFTILLMNLAVLSNQQRYKRTVIEFVGNAPLVTLSGMISIILGFILVMSHNIWIYGWPVVITIISWILLLQGIMRLFAPDAFAKMVKEMVAKPTYVILSWIWLVIAIYLIWAGFILN
ncbi:MAG: hypothetical protein A3E80_06690 [Chlamydiae bacterium RIFCSPHIGHO2_12_FULL_49_9]|nr:MAG: hypothetical protein A3E80_06690 [Chlamydiae bacterium RIFCSPHIGHO2_12_FULL_49_9]